MAKLPKTIQEQIELLGSREMQFRDISKAPNFLANISYYRLKGYWWEMQEDCVCHLFKKDVFFENVIDLYNFDKRFRLIVFNAIESIEISLRTKLIYHMSLAYGADWYQDKTLFDSKYHFDVFVDKINKDIDQSSEEFISKHRDNHPDERPESWKALEVITLNTLSKLYSNLKPQLHQKSKIANEFGLNSSKDLSSWLRTITFIRNIIAHHSRLWNRVMITPYSWPKSTRFNLLSYFPDDERRKKIFPILVAIFYINDRIDPNNTLKEELIELLDYFPIVETYKMGFPPKWKDEPIFKTKISKSKIR